MPLNDLIREVSQHFAKWDDKNSCVVTPDELDKHMAEVCEFFQADEPELVEIFGNDNVYIDGKIEYTEFLDAALNKKLKLA